VGTMKKLLITGGAGFIASHLIEIFDESDEAYKIAILDNFSTGRHNSDLLKAHNVEVHDIDLVDIRNHEDLISSFDIVIHLGAMNRAQRSIEDPAGSHEVNVDSTFYLLEMARKYKFRFVFASSSSVFGNLEVQPRPESLHPTLPTHPYGLGKLIGERYCHIYRKLYDLDIRVIRFFSAFGPRQSPKLKYSAVIPIFIRGFLEKSPLKIYGGDQKRNFTFVKDTAYATYLVATSETCNSDIYQIGGSEEITVTQLYEYLSEIFGYDVPLEYLDYQKGDILKSEPEMNNLKVEYGFRHTTTLKDALKTTAEWMKENPNYFD